MRKIRILFCMALIAMTGCGNDDNPTDTGGSDRIGIAGEWTLQSWVYTRAAPPGDAVDWVTLSGLSGSLNVASDGEFIVVPALPGGFLQDDGMLTVDADSIYWDGHDDEEWVHFTLVDGSLTLSWPEVEFVDMDINGIPEDAWLVVTYEK